MGNNAGVECTAQLVSVRARSKPAVCREREREIELLALGVLKALARLECGHDEDASRLELSMLCIRAVNGLVDPSQKSSRARPISSLARELDLAGWLVELRHHATHNALPTLGVLSAAARELLRYFHANYWTKQAEQLDAIQSLCRARPALALRVRARVSREKSVSCFS